MLKSDLSFSLDERLKKNSNNFLHKLKDIVVEYEVGYMMVLEGNHSHSHSKSSLKSRDVLVLLLVRNSTFAYYVLQNKLFSSLLALLISSREKYKEVRRKRENESTYIPAETKRELLLACHCIYFLNDEWIIKVHKRHEVR